MSACIAYRVSIVTSEVAIVALRRVPRVVTGGPRQLARERREEVVERPRDDHVVVEVRIEGDQHHRVADA